ncbi:MAG: DUF4363 family protein [Clostridia bacterium]|nr:DUF4363 family protein [Clostridia bacterium]
MYKEIIIIVLIVILIFGLNIITQNYTESTAKIMQESLDEIRQDLENNKESKTIQEKINKLNGEWEKRNDNLAYYLEHDELEKIESELTALNSNILTQDYEQGRENLDRCYFLLEHVKDKETVSLSNIF